MYSPAQRNRLAIFTAVVAAAVVTLSLAASSGAAFASYASALRSAPPSPFCGQAGIDASLFPRLLPDAAAGGPRVRFYPLSCAQSGLFFSSVRSDYNEGARLSAPDLASVHPRLCGLAEPKTLQKRE